MRGFREDNYMIFNVFIWSGREDLNLRPLAPHASTLPGCATPRMLRILTFLLVNDNILQINLSACRYYFPNN